MPRPARLLTAALLGTFAAWPREAAGQEEVIEIAWEAPPGCPDREAVRAEIERLLGGRPSAGRARLSALGRIEKRSARYALSLRITPEGGEPGERRIEGPACELLADAAALVVALAFDPDAVAAARDAGEASSAPAPPAPPTPPTPRPEDPAAPETSGAPAPPAGVSGALPPALPVAARPAAPHVSPAFPPIARPILPPPSSSLRFGLTIGAAGDAGTFPNLAPGIAASADLWLRRLRLSAGATYFPARRTSVDALPGAGGAFSMVSLLALACPEIFPRRRALALPAGEVRVSACLGASLDRMAANGHGVSRPGEGSALWVTPDARLSAHAFAHERLAFALFLGLAAPLGAPRFVLDRVGVVHEPAGVVGRGGVGVAYFF